MDDEDKYGIQKYGDLIIWKEILAIAKEKNKSVIFITNDVKEDWYESHDKNENPKCPRHELIKEFQETVGHDVWLYTLKQFIEQLECRFKDDQENVFYSGLDAVKEVLERDMDKRSKMIVVKCLHCDCHYLVNINDFSFCWEFVNSTDRDMGRETEYTCVEYLECPECGRRHKLTFSVWEYPEGVFNHQEIQCDGCMIDASNVNLANYITFDGNAYCLICHSYDTIDENGLCKSCARDMRKEYGCDVE